MSDIKKQLTSGVFYNAVAKYTGVVISIVITGILSRLLTPEDYGTIVPVTVLISFFSILGDIGIGPAVIQSKELSHKELDSLFSFTVITGIILSVLFFMSSWLIAKIYDSDIFILLCQLLSVSLFFSCINVVPNALLFKAKMFRYLAVRSLIVQVVAGIVAIISAFLGAGLYALIIQSLISSFCLFLISYHENPLKLCIFHIEWEVMKKIRNFSSYQFLFDISNYFSVNLDKLLINKYMGAAQLGYYEKSYRLMQMPLQNIPFIITPVLHPIFSDMQNNLTSMRISYSKVIRFLAFVGFPLSILLYFSGQDLIFIIFGSQWTDSIPAFQILALSVGFQIIISTSGSIFQSAGTTHLLFLSGVLSAITVVIAVMTGLIVFGTIEAVSFLLLCAFIINFFQAYLIMYCVLFKTGFKCFIKSLLSPLLLSVILACVLYVLTPIIDDINLLISLFIKGCVALIVSFFYIQYTGEYNLVKKIKEYGYKFIKR